MPDSSLSDVQGILNETATLMRCANRIKNAFILKKGEKRLACGFYRRTFMKKKTYLEFQTNGKAFDADSVQEKIKEELKAEKIVLKKISELNIYINADEDTAYYIAKDADGNELANSSIDVAE